MGLSATSTAHQEASSLSRKNSSALSSSSPKRTHAILSIKPQYAEAIFSGKKRYEFRRSIFRENIRVVVVYTSSPVMQVVGEFSVDGIITEDVAELWARTARHAGIDREAFMEYFSGKDKGHAIKIGSVRRYDKPQDLQATYGVRPPQSFLYL